MRLEKNVKKLLSKDESRPYEALKRERKKDADRPL